MGPVEKAVVTEVSKTATTLLGRIFGPTIDEFGLMYADNMRVRRLKNQIRNFEKVEQMIKTKGFTSKNVDMKAIVPYLDGVALEEDETLQDMWANLIVNYIDAEKNLRVNVYPEILRQISIGEVHVLEYLYNLGIPNYLTDVKGIEGAEVGNSIRLGLIQDPGGIPAGTEDVNDPLTFTYFLTAFGRAFLEACKR